MGQTWLEAGDEYQIPFMAAANRAVNGDYPIQCPKCDAGILRSYFHAFNKEQATGTLWVWCAVCMTTTHLPRVRPKKAQLPDPFAELTLREFAAMELNQEESLLDKLNRLWEEGVIRH